MAGRKRPSMQDDIQQRQQESFVGREDRLAAFREQLTLLYGDRRRRYVLSVFGQGGVGKTTLLREFGRVAAEAGALSALIDDNESGAPQAMHRLVTRLRETGGADATLAFSQFNERYATYRKKRAELEADPDAPQGLAGLFGRTMVHVGAKALRNTTPGADFVLGLIEEPLADQASQWAEFTRRKLGNRDEVKLVLEPAAVLTPLFLAGLDALCAARPVALFFDTYEETAADLDDWLCDLLRGRHGAAPPELTLVVAGRHELNRNAWTELEHVVARLPLDPFTDAEAREFLNRRGVVYESIIAVILKLSSGLPLLLDTLAAANPDTDDPAQVGDASGTAVERFLKWTTDPARRALALDAALPRRLNRDIVGLLADAPDFDWLITNPFVHRLPDGGWAYHQVAREQMLRYKRADSPDGWAQLHERLADHHRATRDALGLADADGRRDPDWRAAALEEQYHRLCARPQGQLAAALNGFAQWLDVGRDSASICATMLKAAGRDIDYTPLQDWGEILGQGLDAYKESQYETTISVYDRLADSGALSSANLAIVYAYRGSTKSKIEQFDAALADFGRAIELDDRYEWAITRRGGLYQSLKRFDNAVKDFSRVIELGPPSVAILTRRGNLYQEMGQYEDALADYTRAIEASGNNIGVIVFRGRFYQEIGRYEEALADFSRAIELSPKDAWAINNRGRFYQKLGRYEEALADFDLAIEVNGNDIGPITNRGKFYQQIGKHEEALADFNRAVELDANNEWLLAQRGLHYQEMGRHEEALADYSRMIELSDSKARALVTRGRFFEKLGRYDDALADFSFAVRLDENDARIVAERGTIFRLMGRYEEALSDLGKAIELDSTYAWAFAGRGMTYRLMGRYDEALVNLNRAIELDPTNDWAIAGRGIVYHALGHNEKALADYNRAIAIDPAYDWAFASRGTAYRALGHYDEAITDFNRAIELDPDYEWAIAGRGVAYRLSGRYEEALADLNRAILLKPEYEWAIAERGETYRQLERYEEALVDFNRAIELDPKHPPFMALRGLVYRQTGRYEEALADYNQAIESNPVYNWALHSRGKTYLFLERYEEALADFRRALDLNPNEDWYHYQNVVTYQRLSLTTPLQVSLDTAITIATEKHQTAPTNLNNLFNLALYHTARGDAGPAEARYREALALPPNAIIHREAITDLEQYLALFPDDALAADMREMLRASSAD